MLVSPLDSILVRMEQSFLAESPFVPMLESRLYFRGHWLDNRSARNIFPIFLAKMKTFPVHLRNKPAKCAFCL